VLGNPAEGHLARSKFVCHPRNELPLTLTWSAVETGLFILVSAAAKAVVPPLTIERRIASAM